MAFGGLCPLASSRSEPLATLCVHGRWTVAPTGSPCQRRASTRKGLRCGSRGRLRRGSPFGIAKLGGVPIAPSADLESTLRARGRPKKKPISGDQRKERAPDPFLPPRLARKTLPSSGMDCKSTSLKAMQLFFIALPSCPDRNDITGYNHPRASAAKYHGQECAPFSDFKERTHTKGGQFYAFIQPRPRNTAVGSADLQPSWIGAVVRRRLESDGVSRTKEPLDAML